MKYLTLHNNTLLHIAEIVFTENMQLMEDKKDDSNVEARMKQINKNSIIEATTQQTLKEVTNSTTVKDITKNNIVSLF